MINISSNNQNKGKIKGCEFFFKSNFVNQKIYQINWERNKYEKEEAY